MIIATVEEQHTKAIKQAKR